MPLPNKPRGDFQHYVTQRVHKVQKRPSFVIQGAGCYSEQRTDYH